MRSSTLRAGTLALVALLPSQACGRAESPSHPADGRLQEALKERAGEFDPRSTNVG